MSFLNLEGLHVFVTGAAGGIGSALVDEFLCMSMFQLNLKHKNTDAIECCSRFPQAI